MNDSNLVEVSLIGSSKMPSEPPSKTLSKSMSIQKSPCINVCQLNSDNLCLGCYRTMDEIGSWSSATNDEKIVIIDNALKRKEIIL